MLVSKAATIPEPALARGCQRAYVPGGWQLPSQKRTSKVQPTPALHYHLSSNLALTAGGADGPAPSSLLPRYLLWQRTPRPAPLAEGAAGLAFD